MLEILGINIAWVFTGVFVVGAALAGLAGVLVAPLGSVGLGMDVEILIEAFVVAVIGGLGSFPGALLGALLIGLTHSFGISFAPRLTIAFSFLVLVANRVSNTAASMGSSSSAPPASMATWRPLWLASYA